MLDLDLPCLTFLLIDNGTLIPDNVPAQCLLLVSALLHQLGLVHNLALLLIDNVAGLGVVLSALRVLVGSANLTGFYML